MEDKKNKPVDKSQLKKPTGKSATGKPLDGVDVNPQLDGDSRKTNEDFVVLTASLQEKKALTLAQRQKRARAIKRIEPKLKRAKEISKSKMAGKEKLQRRAEAAARNILKKRLSARKNVPYAELSTSEKIQVDTAISKKGALIKRIAARLLPKIRKAEFERLKSFTQGKQMKSLHTADKNAGVMPKMEELDNLFNSLNSHSTMQLVDIIENSIQSYQNEDAELAMTLRTMLHAVMPKDPITESLLKKAENSGIPFSTLKEVFERGVSSWNEETNLSEQQYAFNRVHSYIAGGKAWKLDADLREEKMIDESLNQKFNDILEKNTLWDNIRAKRERIKRGSGERMRKPGEKGAPDPGAWKLATESKNKPYVKPHYGNINNPQKQSGWKASNKHGNVKYFGMDFKKSAEKHAGVSEQIVSNVPRDENEVVDRRPITMKTKKRQQQIQKKIIDEDTPSQREVGTDSLVKKYKKDTPGQDSNLNETFNMAWTSGIGVTLTAKDCGIEIKPGFELHPSVEEEVRSADVKGVVVRTASGKTVVRKQKANRKIIGSGNLTDGKPDDTL